MQIRLEEINWLAAVVSAAATFVLGGLWYTALFGKAWARLNGYSDEKLAEMRKKRPPPVFLSIMIVCYLVLSAVVAVLVAGFDVRGAANGAGLGFLLWLGPCAAVAVTGHVASDKPWGALAIDVSFQLISLVMMGAVLAGWR